MSRQDGKAIIGTQEIFGKSDLTHRQKTRPAASSPVLGRNFMTQPHQVKQAANNRELKLTLLLKSSFVILMGLWLTSIILFNTPLAYADQNGHHQIRTSGTRLAIGQAEASYIPLAQQTSVFTLPFVISSTSVLTDYQISVMVDTATPISQGNMRPDCGDIRLYDTDQITALNYWLDEADCDKASTEIWVKVPAIPAASAKTIYLTHGNSSLTSTSDGEAVFEFFDDFSTDKWT
ncbi:MAG: DUF2341 domain-containing protein, partial [Gammaproteobacteria bacterium]|nr:DUF2341 domain-containing protein [Gammaproteobacteria bacterium]